MHQIACRQARWSSLEGSGEHNLLGSCRPSNVADQGASRPLGLCKFQTWSRPPLHSNCGVVKLEQAGQWPG